MRYNPSLLLPDIPRSLWSIRTDLQRALHCYSLLTGIIRGRIILFNSTSTLSDYLSDPVEYHPFRM